MIGHTALLLLTGMALGPNGLSVVTEDVLAHLDPAIPVAVAALGIIVALTLPLGERAGRSFVVSSVGALLTGTIVAAGILVVAAIAAPARLDRLLPLAVTLGVCAALSLARDSRGEHAASTGLDQKQVIVPVLVGGMAIAAAQVSAVGSVLWLVVQACGVASIAGGVGWLLLTRTSSDAEQRVFTIATLLLVGGIADYLSLSAVMIGLVAGAVWRLAGGSARESIRRDVAFLQHPLIALILLAAGARVEFSAALAVLTLGYLVLRAGADLIRLQLRLPHVVTVADRDQSGAVVTSDALGVAFALNAFQTAGPEMTVVLSVVVFGTVASHLAYAWQAS